MCQPVVENDFSNDWIFSVHGEDLNTLNSSILNRKLTPQSLHKNINKAFVW